MKPSLISQVHQAVLGIPNTEDKGLVGDIKDLKAELKETNKHLDDHSYRLKQAEDDIETNKKLDEERHKPSKKAVGGSIVAGIGIIAALIKAFFTSS